METLDAAATFPLVSVIVPTFNRADFLEETIGSILAQDYPNIEVLVLDDGSTDNTSQVLAQYRSRVIVQRHENIGETATVNKGFKLVGGKYVCVVNSDDPILPGLIRAGVIALERNPEALAAYPDWREIGPRSETLKDLILPDYSLETMLREYNVSIGPGVLIRRTTFDIVGLRNPDLRYTGDLDFWHRVMLCGRMMHVRKVLATHRVHPAAGLTTSRGARMADEVARLAYATLDDPRCPADLRKHRRRILAYAHYVARMYCGTASWARRYHYVRYLLLNPANIARPLIVAARRLWLEFGYVFRALMRRLHRLACWLLGRRDLLFWAILCFHVTRLFFLRDIRRSARSASVGNRFGGPAPGAGHR